MELAAKATACCRGQGGRDSFWRALPCLVNRVRCDDVAVDLFAHNPCWHTIAAKVPIFSAGRSLAPFP